MDAIHLTSVLFDRPPNPYQLISCFFGKLTCPSVRRIGQGVHPNVNPIGAVCAGFATQWCWPQQRLHLLRYKNKANIKKIQMLSGNNDRLPPLLASILATSNPWGVLYAAREAWKKCRSSVPSFVLGATKSLISRSSLCGDMRIDVLQFQRLGKLVMVQRLEERLDRWLDSIAFS